MRINHNGDKITPANVAKRLLYFKLEALMFWQEDWEANECDSGDRPITEKQKAAIDKQVRKLVDSITKRYGATHRAGEPVDQVK